MLLELFIQNIAIVSELRVRFNPGFTVLTGETGAGKSVILGALGLVLGDRVKGEILPDGEERGAVEALFSLSEKNPLRSVLRDQNLLPEEGEPLVLRREILRSGNHRNYVNGQYVPLATLKAIGDGLVDFHGQHDHQSLFRAEDQLQLLDHFAGALPLRRETGELFAEAQAASAELARLEALEKEAREKIDFYQFQVNEISQARLEEGEEERLETERNRLAHAEKLRLLLQDAAGRLSEEDRSAVDLVGGSLRAVQEAAKLDPTLESKAERLRALQVELKESAGEISGHLDEIQADPARLAEVEDRLSLIWKLKKKYGSSVGSVLETLAQQKEKLKFAVSADEEKEKLGKRKEAAETALKEKARALKKMRQKGAAELCRKIEKELGELGMPSCKFEVGWAELPAAGPQGSETIEFLIAPNVGESPKPLKAIASGGELSRVMLAVKAVLSEGSGVSTLIFDEIDVNIGAAVGAQVGKKMAALARTKQVLCITHLPQVASLGEHHYRVLKQTARGRTHTSILPLNSDEKKHEVARMLSGEKVTASALQHAQELIEGRKKK